MKGVPSSAAPSTSVETNWPCQCSCSGVSVSLRRSMVTCSPFFQAKQRAGKLAVVGGDGDDAFGRKLQGLGGNGEGVVGGSLDLSFELRSSRFRPKPRGAQEAGRRRQFRRRISGSVRRSNEDISLRQRYWTCFGFWQLQYIEHGSRGCDCFVPDAGGGLISSPLRGLLLSFFPAPTPTPMPCGVSCILPPLRGC